PPSRARRARAPPGAGPERPPHRCPALEPIAASSAASHRCPPPPPRGPATGRALLGVVPRATAPSTPVASSLRPRVPDVAGDQHQCVIRTLAGPREALLRQLLRGRLDHQLVGEAALDPVGGENQHV